MDRSMVGKRLVAIAAGLLSIVFFCGTALGFLGETSRVSVDSAGTEGIGDSHSSSISADGRFVAFVSAATNLVAVDNNGTSDVFVHDRQTGTTTRVSVDSVGAQGNGGSYYPSISADGRFVAFESAATNLVTGDTNGAYDVFVHDLQTGTTTRVSVDSAGTQGNDGSYTPSISADGRFVAFESAATNLVAGDTNGAWDAFVYDRQTGTTTRVSVKSEGNEGNNFSGSPSISADGLFVAFVSAATNLVTGDTNGADDVFVHDLQTGTTTRVSVDSAGIQGIGNCEWPSISADGRFVAFDSAATNLVAGDTEGAWDAFVHDRQTGQTTRVSVDSAGIQGNGNSGITSISGDGRFVTFYSEATNLVAGDTNGAGDVFVHDRQTGQMTRVSVDSAGNEGNGASNYSSMISADGRFVAFGSNATNLVAADTNGTSDVFVHDRHPTTTRVSVDSSGAQGDGLSYRPSISADGRFVAFESYATNLVPDDTNDTLDVFVHDRQTGQTSRVSVDSSGAQVNYDSYHPSISADGRFVAFMSYATNLVPGDTYGTYDVFVHDRQTGQTSRVSVHSAGNEGNNFSGSPSISADGRFVTFDSGATNLVPGDTNDTLDAFVHDRQTGQTSRVSVDSAGNEGNNFSGSPSISADGRFVAFYSGATNLVPVDTNGTYYDVFVHDRQTGQTSRVSVDSSGSQGDYDSYNPSISADGRFVAFESYATNLVPGDTNDTLDAFVHDRLTGETSRVSVDSSGSQGDYDSYHPSISANGRFVAFNSDATNLVAGDTNGARDVFVRELAVVPACTDTDGDGICDSVDNSPNDFNKFQVDTDRDGVGDSADNCPNDPNPGQSPSDPCTTKNSGTAAIIDPVPVYKEGDPVLVRMCFTFTDTLLFHFVPDCYNAVAKLVDMTDPANPHPVHGRCLAGPPYTVNPYPDGDLFPVTGATECIVCDLAKWYPPEVTSVTPGSIRTYQLTGMYQNFVTDYEIDPKIWTQTGDINQACSNEDPLVGCTANVLVGKVAAPPSTIRLENTTDTLVRIEIKPGSPSPKPINLGASVIPVAILGSSTFDVSKVNATSILLQNRGAKVKGNGKPMVSTNDVNRDGYPDLVVQIDAEGIVLSSDVDYAVVTGTYTVGGQLHVFKGYDYIRIVP